jgi:hypothetical protein
MHGNFQGLAVGGHDGSFLVIDRVARLDYVGAVRSPGGEVLSVYLRHDDIEKIIAFIFEKKESA